MSPVPSRHTYHDNCCHSYKLHQHNGSNHHHHHHHRHRIKVLRDASRQISLTPRCRPGDSIITRLSINSHQINDDSEDNADKDLLSKPGSGSPLPAPTKDPLPKAPPPSQRHHEEDDDSLMRMLGSRIVFEFSGQICGSPFPSF